MSDIQVTESLVIKVRGLLALANHHATPEHEAAAAAGMVQKLMAKYNLSVHQLEAAGAKDQLGGKREKRQHDRAAMYNYQRVLMECLAKNNFCRHWIEEVEVPHERKAGYFRKAKRHFLLGRDINVKTTEMVYDYLIETMDRLLPWQGMDKRGKDALLWLLGCAERLIERLNDQRRETEEESKQQAKEDAMRAKHPGSASTGTALVLVDAYQNEEELNEDFIKGHEPGTTTRLRLERDAKSREIDAKIAELRAGGMGWEDAYYTAHYGKIPDWVTRSRERQAAEEAAKAAKPAKPERPETDAQRAKRERRERAWNDQAWRSQNKANAKRYTAAYQMGSKAGADIGLDPQVGNTKKARIT